MMPRALCAEFAGGRHMGRQRNDLSDYVNMKVSKDRCRDDRLLTIEPFRAATTVRWQAAYCAFQPPRRQASEYSALLGRLLKNDEPTWIQTRPLQLVAVSSQQYEIKLWHRLEWLNWQWCSFALCIVYNTKGIPCARIWSMKLNPIENVSMHW